MLKRRFVGKMMMVGVILCTIGTIATTGCLPKPKLEYIGRWDGSGNCVKYGDECGVFSMPFADGYPAIEYVVDLR